MFYDLVNHRRVYALPAGMRGMISFERLIELVKESGEIPPGERVTHLRISDTGIEYRIESVDRGS